MSGLVILGYFATLFAAMFLAPALLGIYLARRLLALTSPGSQIGSVVAILLAGLVGVVVNAGLIRWMAGRFGEGGLFFTTKGSLQPDFAFNLQLCGLITGTILLLPVFLMLVAAMARSRK